MTNLAAMLAADLDAAFPKFVTSTQNRVYSLALSLVGNPADAEDIAQEAYVRAYRALRRYEPGRIRALQVRAWIAKIALNVWRNGVRGSRSASAPLDDEPAGDVRDLPSARAERKEAVADLRAMLARLPDRYRLAVVMRHAFGVPYSEAAAALGVPVGTLKANVHRGTRLLREAFERETKVDRQ